MSPIKVFHKYRGLKNFTLAALLLTVKDLLPGMVGRQRRYKVTDLPSKRTVRYYISRGLVDRPLGRKGTASLFGYRHLLQILAIKCLQYQYLPLEKIRLMLQGLTNRELEQFLPGGSIDAERKRSIAPASGKAAAARNTADEGWRRYIVAPGVEIHLHEDSLSAAGDSRDWEKVVIRTLRGALDVPPKSDNPS